MGVVVVVLLVVAAGAVTVMLGNGDDEGPVAVTSGAASPGADPGVRNEIEELESELGGAAGTASTPAASPSVAAPGVDQSVFALEVGTCFNDPESIDDVRSVVVVPCDQPHDNEVFALVTHPAGPDDPYPGADVIAEFAVQECQGAAFTEYVGIEYARSRYFTNQLTPSDGSWRQGDREVVCILFDPTMQLSGSVRGSAR